MITRYTIQLPDGTVTTRQSIAFNGTIDNPTGKTAYGHLILAAVYKNNFAIATNGYHGYFNPGLNDVNISTLVDVSSPDVNLAYLKSGVIRGKLSLQVGERIVAIKYTHDLFKIVAQEVEKVRDAPAGIPDGQLYQVGDRLVDKTTNKWGIVRAVNYSVSLGFYYDLRLQDKTTVLGSDSTPNIPEVNLYMPISTPRFAVGDAVVSYDQPVQWVIRNIYFDGSTYSYDGLVKTRYSQHKVFEHESVLVRA